MSDKKVIAKFKLDSIESTLGNRRNSDSGEFEHSELKTVKMSPVYGGDPESENAKFWAATPSGQITMSMLNANAAELFELGKEYYIEFTPAA